MPVLSKSIQLGLSRRVLCLLTTSRHCVPKGGSESSSSASASCELQERHYNIGLRVGTLFVVLVTSALGVFVPIFMVNLPMQNVNSIIFTTVKQFGTGVIVSTAFVHVREKSQYDSDDMTDNLSSFILMRLSCSTTSV